jgi:hypothetical protein
MKTHRAYKQSLYLKGELIWLRQYF